MPWLGATSKEKKVVKVSSPSWNKAHTLFLLALCDHLLLCLCVPTAHTSYVETLQIHHLQGGKKLESWRTWMLYLATSFLMYLGCQQLLLLLKYKSLYLPLAKHCFCSILLHKGYLLIVVICGFSKTQKSFYCRWKKLHLAPCIATTQIIGVSKKSHQSQM